jgi:hypothetical protein
MFEPFNPDRVHSYQGFNRFRYMRPNQEDVSLLTFASSLMTGRIRDPWIDRDNRRIFFTFRLIKEIRACLMLKWLNNCFPLVPVLFLMRHPCAVVQSRMALGWDTDDDIEPCLSQTTLIEDCLQDKLDLIRRAASPEEKHAIVWAIANLVPHQQFEPAELNVVFYENLCVRPESELPRIFAAIRQPYSPSALRRLSLPSSTSTRRSAILTGRDRVSDWKRTLSTVQIDRILRIVEAFGLEHFYGDSTLPLQDWQPTKGPRCDGLQQEADHTTSSAK